MLELLGVGKVQGPPPATRPHMRLSMCSNVTIRVPCWLSTEHPCVQDVYMAGEDRAAEALGGPNEGLG